LEFNPIKIKIKIVVLISI